MRCHNGRQGFQLVDQHEISELPRGEEERVSLFERHRRTEFGLVIVIAKVSDLVQVTESKEDVLDFGSAHVTEGKQVLETLRFPYCILFKKALLKNVHERKVLKK